MRSFSKIIAGLCCVMSAGCTGSEPWVPLTASSAARAEPELTLVWVGRGECEHLDAGKWLRCPTLDYDFSVEQRRYRDHWESVKSLRRRDPGYDGSAGPRLQTWFFRLDLGARDAQGHVPTRLTSSLGDGDGRADAEFRSAELRFEAKGVSKFAPFDRYRITQSYDYEGGRLTELVELNEGDAPWVRNRETATLFAAERFATAPTVR